jgi:hygromycin-B 4-O-kinase
VDLEQSGLADSSASGGARGVSEARARDFLIARFGREASEVSRVVQGEWSKAYGFRNAGGEYIIRFSALDEDFAKDRLAAFYSSPNLPIPRIVEVGEAFGGFYAISERASGDYLDAVDGNQMRELLPALFAALDDARLVDLSASAEYGGWDADGTAPYSTWRAALLDVAVDRPSQRTYGWRPRLAASPTGSAPFEEAYERLQSLAECAPTERHLIHGDLLNHNVLVTGDRLTAVFDWGCAMYGDFLYDVAWFAFWSPWYPAWQGIDFAREAARHYESIGLDAPHFAERLLCCELHIGLGDQAYNAFKGRWTELEAAARRTLDLARRAP